MNKSQETSLVIGATPEFIARRIILVRGQKVMLSPDLAELYQVEPRTLMQAVKRNLGRFPSDFMFQLVISEAENLKSQFVISSWGGRRSFPYAFTELGVAMLSSVLNSDRAVQMNIFIMRAFVKLRQLSAGNKELANKVDKLELEQIKQGKDLDIVYTHIKKFMDTPLPTKERLGF